MGAEFVKELVRYTIPRPIRNWLRSPARSFEWIADSALFSLGVTKRLHLSESVNLILHPYAFKVGQRAQIVGSQHPILAIDREAYSKAGHNGHGLSSFRAYRRLGRTPKELALSRAPHQRICRDQ